MPIISTGELFANTGNVGTRTISTEELFGDAWPAKPEGKSLSQFGKNAGRSLYRNTAGIVLEPIKEAWQKKDIRLLGEPVKAIFQLGGGIVEKALPDKIFGRSSLEDIPEAVASNYKQAYGGGKNIINTLYEDPFRVAGDVSILAGSGAGLIKAGQASKIAQVSRIANLPKIAKAANVALKVSEVTNPMSMALKGTGKVLSGTGQVIKKVSAPFASKVSQPITQSAKNLGVLEQIPASARTTSYPAQAVETIAGKGLFGGKIVEKVNNLEVSLNNIANNLQSSIGKTNDLSLIGKNISDGTSKFKDTWISLKNELYKKANIPMWNSKGGSGVLVKPAESKAFIDKVLSSKLNAKQVLPNVEDLSFYRSLSKNLTPDGVNARYIHSAIKELNEKLKNFNDPFVTGNKGTLEKLVATLSDELDTAIKVQRPELAKAIDKANQFYQDGLLKINSTWGKKINALAETKQYDKIVPAIINPATSVDDIPRILEVVGKKNIPDIQSHVLQDIFKTARGASDTFTPLGFNKAFNKYSYDKLQLLLNPEQLQVIQDIANVSKGLGMGQKIARGSQTAFISRLGGEGALVLSSILHLQNPLPILGFIAGDAAFSKLIGSKLGQKYLTEGFTAGKNLGAGINKTGTAISNLGRYKTYAPAFKKEIPVPPPLPLKKVLGDKRGIYGGQGATGFNTAEGKFSALTDKMQRFEISDKGAKLLPERDYFGEMNRIKKENTSAYKSMKRYGNMPVFKMSGNQLSNYEKLKQSVDFKEINYTRANKLSDVLDHPEFYKQYPELANTKIKFITPSNSSDIRGLYDSENNIIEITNPKFLYNQNEATTKSIILHEIQHAIQEKEGFARGGSPSSLYNTDEVRKAISEIEKIQNKFPGEHPSAFPRYAREEYQKYAAIIKDNQYDGFDRYTRLAGEVEARDVSARMGLTPKQRLGSMPYSSQNIPIDNMIVSKKGMISEFFNADQINLLKKAEIPKEIIPEYVTNSLADGAKLREYTTKVNAGLMSEQEAVKRIKADVARLIK